MEQIFWKLKGIARNVPTKSTDRENILNKRNFVKLFAKRAKCRDDEAALVLEGLLKTIVKVTADDNLYFVGFGEFKRHQRKSKNGDTNYLAELRFKASADLPETYWQEWDVQNEQNVQVEMLSESVIAGLSGETVNTALNFTLQEDGTPRE